MITVLVGLAGSGKTELLTRLASLGEQTLDLEGLARHRGSAFGSLGQPPQPTHAEFQSAVRATLRAADPNRPLWVEDEGDYLGSVGLPAELISLLATASCVEVHATRPERVDRIVAGYADAPLVDWLAAVDLIAQRLGEQRTRQVRTALSTTDRPAAVDVLLDYYDDGYRHRLRSLARPRLGVVTAADAPGARALTAPPPVGH